MEFIYKKDISYILFANKQDLNSSIPRIDLDVLVIPTIAAEGIGINDGLKMLLKLTGSRVKQDIIQKNENSGIISSTNNNHNIKPKRELSDIIKELKSADEKDPQKLDFRKIIKKIKPLNEKDAKKPEICKLKLFMHPIEIENVKNALESRGFFNITMIEVGYVDNRVIKENYRGSNYNVIIPQKAEINMVIKREEVK